MKKVYQLILKFTRNTINIKEFKLYKEKIHGKVFKRGEKNS